MLFGTYCGCQPALFSVSLSNHGMNAHMHTSEYRMNRKEIRIKAVLARLGTGMICIIAFDKNALPIKYHSSLNCLGFNKLSYFHIFQFDRLFLWWESKCIPELALHSSAAWLALITRSEEERENPFLPSVKSSYSLT